MLAADFPHHGTLWKIREVGDLANLAAFEHVKKWEPLLRRSIVGILALLFGVLLSRLIWVIVEPGGAVSETSNLPRYSVSSSTSPNSSVETNLLTSLNPFDIDAFSGEVLIEDAPETALNLILLGSRAATTDDLASAIIRTPDNVASVYSPGDEIISGVFLEQVLPDQQVLLRRNGVLESLGKEGRTEGLRVIGRDDALATSPASTGAVPVKTGSFRVEDGLALFNSMSIQGVRDNNNLTGYRLSARDDGELMRAAGLVPGDIIKSFDGDRVGDIVLGDVRDRLVNGSEVTLTVEREGRIEIVTLAIGR